MMSFGKNKKLSPRFVGPYQILKHIWKFFYELDFSNKLVSVHPVFHVSMLESCIQDLLSIIPMERIGVDESLSCEEVQVEILLRQFKRLIIRK